MISPLFNAAAIGIGLTATAIGLTVETGRLILEGVNNE
jgi:hypothetical protein